MPAKPDARERILSTADRLFYAHGVRAVGVDRVVAEAGVAKMTLYAHFPGKDDLVVAVLERRDAATTGFFADAVGRHRRAGADPVRAVFAAVGEFVRSPGFRGCAFQNAVAELADPAHPAAVYARGYKRRFREALAGWVAEAVGPAGRAAAPAVSLLIEGALATAAVDGRADAVAVARDAAIVLLAAAK